MAVEYGSTACFETISFRNLVGSSELIERKRATKSPFSATGSKYTALGVYLRVSNVRYCPCWTVALPHRVSFTERHTVVTLFWQYGNTSGVRVFDSVAAAAAHADNMLRLYPSMTFERI